MQSVSDVKKRLFEYFFYGAFLWAITIAVTELLVFVPVLSVERLFLWLYFGACFSAGFVLIYLGKETLIPKLTALLPLIVLISSRDMLLFSNALCAFVLFVVLFTVSRSAYAKWFLRIITPALLVVWFMEKTIPRDVAVCLLVLSTAVVAGIFGRTMAQMVPALLLAVILAACLPSSDEPMRWERVRAFISRTSAGIQTAWENVTWFFEGLSGGGDAAYTGYSDTGKLQGSTHANERISLYFETTNKKDKVYLKGAEYSKMDKDGFPERSDEEGRNNAWIALYMSALANAGTTHDEAWCFSKLERAKVTYAYLKTKDLMRPSGLVLTSGGSEKKTKKKGYTYDVLYISFDYASPYYKRLTRAAQQFREPASYEAASAAALELYNLRLSDYMSESEYEKCVKEADGLHESGTFTDTSMATDRIRELAESLTKDCETELEKAEIIEAFLRQYPYDPQTDLKNSDNYVESFLFETQKGYCVHYASAMVLMLRLCGIPARYVQGFVYSPENEGVVYGKNAHAWVEAYIVGIGWVTFEPTGIMENAEQRSWHRGLRDPEEEEAIEEELIEEEKEQLPPEIPESTVRPVIREEEKTDMKKILLTVGGYVLAALGSLAIVLALFILIKRIRYNRLSPEEKLIRDMEELTGRLNRLYPAVAADAPVREYLPYVEDVSLRDELANLSEGYYRVRFRKDAPPPELVTGVREMTVTIKHLK